MDSLKARKPSFNYLKRQVMEKLASRRWMNWSAGEGDVATLQELRRCLVSMMGATALSVRAELRGGKRDNQMITQNCRGKLAGKW
jgi:hypothetical protein